METLERRRNAISTLKQSLVREEEINKGNKEVLKERSKEVRERKGAAPEGKEVDKEKGREKGGRRRKNEVEKQRKT